MPPAARWTKLGRYGVRVFFRPLYAPRCLARATLSRWRSLITPVRTQRRLPDGEREVGHGESPPLKQQASNEPAGLTAAPRRRT
jgi:hypothetical protein